METTKPIHARQSLYAFYFEVIKDIGLKYGYNIVLHGSMSRDLDLIAIPWQEKIGDKHEMLKEICELLDGSILTDDKRITFHGREIWIININRRITCKYDGMSVTFERNLDPQYYIDISIIPHQNKN